jgi:gamma-glutamylcyclotransferase (GGCT)/AIG2-like uncharacterized protein YtfP
VINRLFVYGTLAPGRPNEHVLADVPGTWEPATVQGRLVNEGWGAKLGYPAIVPSSHGQPGDVVHGFVFASPDLPAHWKRLDEFEGHGYERAVVYAKLQDGAVVEAQTYALSERCLPPDASARHHSSG